MTPTNVPNKEGECEPSTSDITIRRVRLQALRGFQAPLQKLNDARAVDAILQECQKEVDAKESVFRREHAASECKMQLQEQALRAAHEDLEKERHERLRAQDVCEQNESELTSLTEENARLKNEISSAKRELNTSRDECKMLRRQLELLDREKEMQMGEAECATERQKHLLNQEVNQAQEQVENLNAELAAIQVERDRLKSVCDEMKRTHKQKRKAWKADRITLVTALDAATRANSKHLQELSKAIGPGGALQQSLDAVLTRSPIQHPQQNLVDHFTRMASTVPTSSICSSPLGSASALSHAEAPSFGVNSPSAVVIGHPCDSSLLMSPLQASAHATMGTLNIGRSKQLTPDELGAIAKRSGKENFEL